MSKGKATCTECGRDTPANVFLCVPCRNDPDYADYRIEWEIWEQKCWEADQRAMLEDLYAIDDWMHAHSVGAVFDSEVEM